jgi:uncharacterized OsmC-like protein
LARPTKYKPDAQAREFARIVEVVQIEREHLLAQRVWLHHEKVLMKIEELRAIQAPIKENYKQNPSEGLRTLRSTGVVDVDHQQCRIESHAGTIRAGLHPAAGGSASDACSAELLLESLIACAGVTFAAVATNMNLKVKSCTIEAEGDMDFRGTLGVEKTVPVGLTAIRLRFQVDSDLDETALAKLISLTERYCVIYQTLRNGVMDTSTTSGNSPGRGGR